jgi:C_GCAxxG_C_C family probable redox protein
MGTHLALQETFGIRDDSAFRASAGLHGGIGGKNDVCGALLGAGLMLGLMFGKDIEEEKKQTSPKNGEPDAAIRLTGELYRWFKKEFGSVKCRSIQKKYTGEVNAESGDAALTDPEITQRVFKKCDRLTAETAARAAEMIYDEMEADNNRG